MTMAEDAEPTEEGRIEPAELARLTADVVAAYVSHCAVSLSDLGRLIEVVSRGLQGIGHAPEEAPPSIPEPAVPVGRSISPDQITCLVCGKALKLLKRHLTTAHELTPAAYRELFGLNADYPMAAPRSAQQRPEMALRRGLGRIAKPVRIPITLRTATPFTVALSVGSGATPINVILDTGSSMLAVGENNGGDPYDASKDRESTTTRLLQTAEFGHARLLIASVVRTRIGLMADGATAIAVPNANLAVAYDIPPNAFSRADGILGLAYSALNKSYLMPMNTWDNRYPADQVTDRPRAPDLEPYVDQAVVADLVDNKFAFAVRRSVLCEAEDDPAAANRLNTGILVLGDCEECTDLYTGAFTSVAVVHNDYYNTNIIAVQVGDRTVDVPRVPAGGPVASNSVVDSGNPYLTLDPDVYRQVIDLFNAINPNFGAALESSSACDQTALVLDRWPTLRFVLQGADGGQVTIGVEPKDYWQFDSYGPGKATNGLKGDSPHPGRSILGLPLFTGYYVVFDRTAASGQGVIKFAARR
jgi:predicted transcriptional regulator